MSKKQFWIVGKEYIRADRPNLEYVTAYDGSNANKKYFSLAEAMAEADKQAKKYPGQRFVVLSALSEFTTAPPPPPVVVSSLYGCPDTIDEDTPAQVQA